MQRREGPPTGPDQDPVPPPHRRLALDPAARRWAPEPATDEAAAQQARRRLREQGIVPIEPDSQIAGMLDPDELLLAVRRSVELDRRQPDSAAGRGLEGDLYVTTRRLVHLGAHRISYRLGEIREAVVVDEELLLMLEDGMGVAIAARDPRLLRVEIAAARAAARVGRGG